MSNEINTINMTQPPQRTEASNSTKARTADNTRTAEIRHLDIAGARQKSAESRQSPVAGPGTAASARPQSRDAVAVLDLKSEVQRIFREIDLHVDPDLDDVVVRVVDRETGELVRQIPSEELLELARNLHELREQAVGDDMAAADAAGGSQRNAKEGLLIHTKA